MLFAYIAVESVVIRFRRIPVRIFSSVCCRLVVFVHESKGECLQSPGSKCVRYSYKVISGVRSRVVKSAR